MSRHIVVEVAGPFGDVGPLRLVQVGLDRLPYGRAAHDGDKTAGKLVKEPFQGEEERHQLVEIDM